MKNGSALHHSVPRSEDAHDFFLQSHSCHTAGDARHLTRDGQCEPERVHNLLEDALDEGTSIVVIQRLLLGRRGEEIGPQSRMVVEMST